MELPAETTAAEEPALAAAPVPASVVETPLPKLDAPERQQQQIQEEEPAAFAAFAAAAEEVGDEEGKTALAPLPSLSPPQLLFIPVKAS